jgi:hypothetical protein
MTESLDGVSPGNAEPTSVDSAPEQSFGLVGGSGGVAGGRLETDNEADLGGHTLLSRSPAFQGRRSLFRR